MPGPDSVEIKSAGVTKNAMDAEQSSNSVLEITPLYPPYSKGEGERNNAYFKNSPLKVRGTRGVMRENAL